MLRVPGHTGSNANPNNGSVRARTIKRKSEHGIVSQTGKARKFRVAKIRNPTSDGDVRVEHAIDRLAARGRAVQVQVAHCTRQTQQSEQDGRDEGDLGG